MVIIDFVLVVVFVAIYATEYGIIARYYMAIDALIPFSVVVSAVDREILIVVVPGRWRPGALCMAILTGGRELRRLVVGVIRVVILALVATEAGRGRIVVIAVVAGVAIVCDGGMGPDQLVIVIVNGECGRHPVGGRGMAHRTIGRYPQCLVVGIGALCIIRRMAALAGVGRIIVIPVDVAGCTVVGYR